MNNSGSFDDSVAEFARFLEDNGYSPNVSWVTPDDIVVTGTKLVYVKVPVPKINERKTRREFEIATKSGRGILLAALCQLDSVSCCYLWSPSTPLEAEERMMPEGIKMSVRSRIATIDGKPVHSTIHWYYLRAKYRKFQKFKRDILR